MNLAFTLTDPLGIIIFLSIITVVNNTFLTVDYSQDEDVVDCVRAECELKRTCGCSKCMCCSFCTEFCACPKAKRDHNEKLASILDLGDEAYRYY